MAKPASGEVAREIASQWTHWHVHSMEFGGLIDAIDAALLAERRATWKEASEMVRTWEPVPTSLRVTRQMIQEQIAAALAQKGAE